MLRDKFTTKNQRGTNAIMAHLKWLEHYKIMLEDCDTPPNGDVMNELQRQMNHYHIELMTTPQNPELLK